MIFLMIVLLIVFLLVFCGKTETKIKMAENTEKVDVTADYKINELERGLSSVKFDNDYAFDKFIENGGAKSDSELVSFLKTNIFSGDIDIKTSLFGCSTLAVKNNGGEYIFGRNFDWGKCDALIIIFGK